MEERWVYVGIGCCDLLALIFFASGVGIFVAGRSSAYDSLEVLESVTCIEHYEYLDNEDSMVLIYDAGIALLIILSLWICSEGFKVLSWETDFDDLECVWVACFLSGFIIIHGLAQGMFVEYLILKSDLSRYWDSNNVNCIDYLSLIESLEKVINESWIYHTVGLSCLWFNVIILFMFLCTPCREEQSERMLGNPFRILHDRGLLCRIQVMSIRQNPRAFCARRICCCCNYCLIRYVGLYVRMQECYRRVCWCCQPVPEPEPDLPESAFVFGHCPLCLEDSQTLVATRGCEHAACKPCLMKYLKSDLKNVQSYPRVCFHPDCRGLLQYSDVSHILEPAMLREYDRMQALAAMPPEERATCPVCLTISAIGRNAQVRCASTSCNQEFCSSCQVIWHDGVSCEQYQSRLANKNYHNEEKFKLMVEQEKWQKCPSCGAMIEKTEGCNHITHKACTGDVTGRTDFCYCCSQKLTGEGHRFEEGTDPLIDHFPNGVYKICRAKQTDANIEVKAIE